MDRRVTAVIAIVLGVIVALGATACARQQPSDVAPQDTGHESKGTTTEIQNVILISMDTTRWDVLSPYNAPDIQSPNIGQFAQENIVFENCYAPVAVTLPAHATMLTGLTPPQLAVLDNNHYVLAGSHTTLAEILKENQFQTAAFVSAFVLDSMFGLDQGFDTYDDDVESQLGIPERRGDETTARAIEWLEANRGHRNFLFIHYFDPHAPYDAPEPFAARFKEIYREYPEFVQDYVGEIAFTDHCIGQLLARLKELGLYESSLICITADHGESHEEHGEFSHGFFIYNSTIKVPLIFKAPGYGGHIRVPDFVGLVDIVPTICAALGIEIAGIFSGRDLTDNFHGIENLYPDRPIFSYSIEPKKYGANSLLGVIFGGYKYIHTTRPELYNISNDIYERMNLIDVEPNRVRLLREELRNIVDDFAAHTTNERTEFDAETVRKLESLGYVGTTESASIFEFDPSASDPKDLIDYHDLLQIARAYVSPDDRAKTLSAAESMIEMRPDLFHGYVMKGKILTSMGRRDDAVPFLERAAELDPEGTRAQLQTTPPHDPAR
jgi:arylsulfatase A-like enzyme